MNRYRMVIFLSVLILFIFSTASAQVEAGNVITFGHYECCSAVMDLTGSRIIHPLQKSHGKIVCFVNG